MTRLVQMPEPHENTWIDVDRIVGCEMVNKPDNGIKPYAIVRLEGRENLIFHGPVEAIVKAIDDAQRAQRDEQLAIEIDTQVTLQSGESINSARRRLIAILTQQAEREEAIALVDKARERSED